MIKKAIILSCITSAVLAVSIDFQTSLKKTVQNNKELKAKKLNIQKAKEDLKEAKGYELGKLQLSENISKTNHAGYVFGSKLASREATFNDFGFGHFIDQMGGLMNPATAAQTKSDLLKYQPSELNNPASRNNFETKLTYEVPIFTGFKLENAQTMAQLQILAQNAKYQFDEKRLGLEVLKAYNGAVASKHFIQATKKAKKATSSFVIFAKELFKEGLVTAIDVKQAKVYDIGVDAKVIEAQNRYDLAVAYLKFLTDDHTITDVKEFEELFCNAQTGLKSLQDNAVSNRDDYGWMKHNTQTMKKNIDMVSAEEYPMVGAFMEYGFNDDRFGLDHDKDYYVMAVGMKYTLFDGDRIAAQKQKAKIDYKKTKYYFEYMKEGIKLEVEKNFLTLQTKEKIVEQKIKAQSLAEEVLLQSQEMYKNQLITMNNLLMQQANVQKSRAETILSKYEKTIAQAQLKLSLGQSLDTTINN